jgi:diacylglycerol kinase family enzyme
MLIIVNPYATTVSPELRHRVVSALHARYDVDAVDTERQGHATELCRQAARDGYDVVVAFGGDGTANESANGLIGSATALSCLPGGSANVFCKMLGIPSDLIRATEHLLGLAEDWQPRRVDLASVNGRHFTFSSGLGLDASVVQRVDHSPRLKRRFGPWFFAWAAVSSFLARYLVNPPRMRVAVADQSLEGVTAIVQNGRPFTFFHDRPIEIAEGVSLTSGTLAGCVLRKARPHDLPLIALRACFTRAHVVRYRQVAPFADVSEVVVSSLDGRALPLQVDGDYLGEVTEARYGISPGALLIVS